MRNKELLRLVAGFRRFREKYFEESDVYQRLSTGGQSPKSLVIACSDSRVDPAIVLSSHPGEFFTVRNVANLVPPYEKNGGFHGVSSAIEFAVVNLQVQNIIVMGHRQCGGIRALMLEQAREGSFIAQWMKIAQEAKYRVLQSCDGADDETLCRQGEMESIVTSLENLRTFPFVQEAIAERGMSLIGTYFDLEMGEMFEYEKESGKFKAIDVLEK